MAKGMQGRQLAMATLLDREVQASTDPADHHPFYAAIFPFDDHDLTEMRQALEDANDELDRELRAEIMDERRRDEEERAWQESMDAAYSDFFARQLAH